MQKQFWVICIETNKWVTWNSPAIVFLLGMLNEIRYTANAYFYMVSRIFLKIPLHYENANFQIKTDIFHTSAQKYIVGTR